jgi:hypothetical protein
MAVTFAQPSGPLAPHAQSSEESREAPNSQRSQLRDDTTKLTEEGRRRCDSLFDCLRRALAAPHV